MESQNLLAVSFSSGSTLLYLPELKEECRNFGKVFRGCKDWSGNYQISYYKVI